MGDITIINVHGQFYGHGDSSYYTYPSDKRNGRWENYFKDWRSVFGGGQNEYYSIWCSDEGWWVSKVIRTNPHDFRHGPAEVAFCLGANRPKTGRDAKSFLDNAMYFFVTGKELLNRDEGVEFNSGRFWKDSDTEHWLMSHEVELDLVYCPIKPFNERGQQAYRAYQSDGELNLILTFISQEGYASYCRIWMIGQEGIGTIIDNNACDITDKIPIRRILKVVPFDKSVKPLVAEVNEGGSFNATYTKPGFSPLTRTVKAVQSQDGYIDGDCYYVYGASRVSEPFYKTIYLTIVDENGKTASGTTQVSVNNGIQMEEWRTYPKCQDSAIRVYEGYVCHINLSNTAYDNLKWDCSADGTIDHRSQNIKDNIRYTIKLKRKYFTVQFEVGGYTWESKDPVKQGDSKYQTLIQYGAEVSPGPALTFHVEKKGVKSNYRDYNGTGNIHTDEDPHPHNVWKIVKTAGVILAFIVGFLFIYYGLDWVFDKLSDNSMPNTETVKHEGGDGADSASENKDSHNEEEKVKEVKDIDYLKNADTWEKSSLKSDKYQRLFDFISNGQIDQINQTNWFKGQKVNGYWVKIAKILNLINKRNPKYYNYEADFEGILKNNASNSKIPLSNLTNNLNNEINQINQIDHPHGGGNGGGPSAGNGRGLGNGNDTGSGKGGGMGSSGL